MFIRFLTFALVCMPSLALAAPIPTYKELVGKAAGILQATVSIIFWIIFFYVAWTVVQNWARHGDDPKAIATGKNTIVAGIIGLVVLGSLWGLVSFVKTILLG